MKTIWLGSDNMPKIIKNLEEKIFISAKELFCKNGYENVDMKTIAVNCNIAVGTLYNYFPNKKELYLSVVTKSWNNTFNKLGEIIEHNEPDISRIKSCIKILYEDIENREGLGSQMGKIKDMEKKEFEEYKKTLINSLKKIFDGIKIKEEFKNDDNIIEKLIYTLVTNISMLIEVYNEDKELNINYICNIIKVYIEM